MPKRPNDKLLPAVNPNAGLQAWYRKKLLGIVEDLHRAVMRWVLAAYRKNEPAISELAQDEVPADALRKALNDLAARKLKGFDDAAEELAKYFAQSASQRSDAALRAILKKAGISVDFRMTAAQRDILKATVNENVSLIKSIPEQYLKDVEGAVMRSVQVGRDIGALSKELQQKFGVAKRRAEFISRDQNNKASSMLNRGRQIELGITEAEWRHSHAGKNPRRSHVAMNGKRYSIADGWYDPDAKQIVWPGTLPNCRCTSKSIIPGFI
jgi:SPP1 gp7 family putative phage head morphogenesis protein